MFHYLVNVAGKLVAVAHARTLGQAKRLTRAAGIVGYKLEFNDPEKGYIKSSALTPKLEKF